jgi:ClpP class serine protease
MCAGEKSYALETSLVGSIGVISSTFGAVDAAKRLGIERRVYTAGGAKAQMDPLLPVQPEQEERLRDLMGDLHSSFQRVVQASRGERWDAGPSVCTCGWALGRGRQHKWVPVVLVSQNG